MNVKIQFMLDNSPLLKRFLREHSNYYKNIIRNPSYINTIIELMKKEYKLTLPDKLTRIKDNIGMISGLMDVIK